MWNLKNKTNKQNKTKSDSKIQRTNRWLPDRRQVGEWEKWVKGIKRYKLPVKK